MWYWTKFTLRMMASVGLAAAVVLCLVGQCRPTPTKFTVGRADLIIQPNRTAVGILGFPSAWTMPAPHIEMFKTLLEKKSVDPNIDMLGNRAWYPDYFSGVVLIQIDHWLLCLTFLIATVVTSWRFKPNGVQAEEAGAKAESE